MRAYLHDGQEPYALHPKAGYIGARPNHSTLTDFSCNAPPVHTLESNSGMKSTRSPRLLYYPWLRKLLQRRHFPPSQAEKFTPSSTCPVSRRRGASTVMRGQSLADSAPCKGPFIGSPAIPNGRRTVTVISASLRRLMPLQERARAV